MHTEDFRYLFMDKAVANITAKVSSFRPYEAAWTALKNAQFTRAEIHKPRETRAAHFRLEPRPALAGSSRSIGSRQFAQYPNIVVALHRVVYRRVAYASSNTEPR